MMKLPLLSPREYLPGQIADRVNRKIRARIVYCYAGLHRPGCREKFWQAFDALTLADLEQLTEHHRRRARKAIVRFAKTRSAHTAETAADHIFRAELYRRRFRELLGDKHPESFVDHDPVFPEFAREATP